MDETGVSTLRNELRQALEAAQAAGVPPMTRLALLVVQLGREMSEAGRADELHKLVANIQAAVEHAALAAGDERETLERFGGLRSI